MKAVAWSVQPLHVTRQWEAIIRQRIYAIAAGFGDLNDHQQLRIDAALQSAVGAMEPMGSASILCRVEAVRSLSSERAARKRGFPMHELILKQFIDSYDKPPKSLVLQWHSDKESLLKSATTKICVWPWYVQQFF